MQHISIVDTKDILLLVVYHQPVKDAYRRYSTPDRVEGEVEVEGEVVGEVEGDPLHPEM